MKITHSLSCLVFVFLVILGGNSTALSSNAEESSASEYTDQRPEPKPKPYAFVISGGVSLGAYEAGINWSVLKAMKLMRDNEDVRNWTGGDPMMLNAVAGASAGGVNSLVTAISWCATDKLNDTVDNNLFKNTWVDIGLDDLFPDSPTEGNSYANHAYKHGDALFTRKTLEDRLADINAVLENPQMFRPNCHIPIGLVVTRSHARTFKFQDDEIDVPNERFVVPIQLTTGEGGGIARFKNFDLNSGDNIIYLQENSIGNFISNTNVFNLIKATSAFPVAFGSQDLKYCINGEGASDGTDCPAGYGRKTSRFVDGGVFDNIPLGVAIDLMTKKSQEAKEPRAKEFSYFYIDPDKRRGPARNDSDDDTDAPRIKGLLKDLYFLKDAYSTARKYELYKTLKKLEAEEALCDENLSGVTLNRSLCHSLKLSDRHPPITGSYLLAFGAFFDKSFRLYDYYAGVYDGVVFLAKQQCKGKDEEDCMIETIKTWMKHLKISKDMHQLAFCLFGDFLSSELSSNLYGIDNVRKACESHVLRGDNKNNLSNLVMSVSNSIHQEGTNKEPEFEQFIANLKKKTSGPGSTQMSNSLKTLVLNDNWKNIYLHRASQRLIAMEDGSDGESDYDYIKPLAALAGEYSLKKIKNNTQGRVCRPSYNGNACWFMPYEASINANGRGAAFSTEYRYRKNNQIFNLKLTPQGYEGPKDNRINYTQLDLFYENAWVNDMLGKSYLLSSFGVGPTITWGHNEADEGTYTGASMYIGFLGDIFRLTYGIRDNSELSHRLGGDDYLNRDDHFVYLGITDISGIFYWIFKAM